MLHLRDKGLPGMAADSMKMAAGYLRPSASTRRALAQEFLHPALFPGDVVFVIRNPPGLWITRGEVRPLSACHLRKRPSTRLIIAFDNRAKVAMNAPMSDYASSASWTVIVL
jgi:hypothetical protein